jgi:hypothetical protein
MQYAVGILVLAIAVYPGLRIGRALRSRRERDYWIANGVAVLFAMLVAAVGQTLAVPYMAAAGIGMGFGLLTGMKYGLGAVTGRSAPEGRE